MTVIKITPEQITLKKRKRPKGHAIDLGSLRSVGELLGSENWLGGLVGG